MFLLQCNGKHWTAAKIRGPLTESGREGGKYQTFFSQLLRTVE